VAPFIAAWGDQINVINILDTTSTLRTPLEVDGRRIDCLYPPPHQTLPTISSALRFACPGPLSELGRQLGPEEVANALEAFSFGVVPEIELLSAEPDPVSLSVDRESLEMASIGQAATTLTPLQVARAFAAFANDGSLPSLRLVDAIRSSQEAWTSQRAANAFTSIIEPAIAKRIMGSAESFDDDIRGFTFVALAGEKENYLTWFLGERTINGAPYVTVVLLEKKDPNLAQEIGKAALLSLPGP
jgi:cell division protein FtsI/penicillin-binding protein 2